MRIRHTLFTLFCVLVTTAVNATAHAQAAGDAQTAEQRVAAIKQNLAQSRQNLKQYQWTETTVVKYKGDEKANMTHSCAYGADGKIVRTRVAAPAEAEKKRGLVAKIVEHKKEELTDYMESALAMIRTYIPLDPAKIQACRDAGKMSTTVIEPGKRAKINFKDYEKPGDDVGVEIDITTNQLLGFSIASYLADTKDAINLNVAMAALPDGTTYPATIKAEAPAKDVAVAITNSAYEKKANK
jgi:hypothetical protein